MCDFPGTKAGDLSTACNGVLQGREGLCLGPIRVGSFCTVSESSSLFKQSKGGSGGSFCQSNQRQRETRKGNAKC